MCTSSFAKGKKHVKTNAFAKGKKHAKTNAFPAWDYEFHLSCTTITLAGYEIYMGNSEFARIDAINRKGAELEERLCPTSDEPFSWDHLA